MVFSTVPEQAAVSHISPLTYLHTCWSSHVGVVVTPDMVWFTLLCQVAKIIRGDAERFRPLFSSEGGKQSITVPTNSVVRIPLDTLAEQIAMRLPSQSGSSFYPAFSQSSTFAREAALAAFADAMSPYYQYSTMLCGISKVRLGGTTDDWRLLQRSWSEIAVLLLDLSTDAEAEWLVKVGILVGGITVEALVLDDKKDEAATLIAENDRLSRCLRRGTWDSEVSRPFWRSMFRIDSCGSGHEVVRGWFTDLFYEPTLAPRDRSIYGFTGQSAMVEYTNLDTSRRFRAVHGLFTSELDEAGYLVPEFGQMVLEVTSDPEGYAPKGRAAR